MEKLNPETKRSKSGNIEYTFYDRRDYNIRVGGFYSFPIFLLFW